MREKDNIWGVEVKDYGHGVSVVEKEDEIEVRVNGRCVLRTKDEREARFRAIRMSQRRENG